MLFIDRFPNQSVLITIPSGETIRVEIIGETNAGEIRLGFDGSKETFKVSRLSKEDRARFNLKKGHADKDHSTAQFPSDHNNDKFN